MIVGVGNDLVDIDRVKRIIDDKAGERFLDRILTPSERRLADERKGRLYEFAAGRFAAKEAVVKALGCGIGEHAGFQDIEITPDKQGKPVCTINSTAIQKLGIPENIKIHISISHASNVAGAVAVIESV